eukprot:Mrub_09949.p1 GENE.Mrub_09949~~Mrub_09949.p1  ORF type:complete len:215 (+),score=33.94 Mrub_09949:87-647(+)
MEEKNHNIHDSDIYTNHKIHKDNSISTNTSLNNKNKRLSIDSTYSFSKSSYNTSLNQKRKRFSIDFTYDYLYSESYNYIVPEYSEVIYVDLKIVFYNNKKYFCKNMFLNESFLAIREYKQQSFYVENDSKNYQRLEIIIFEVSSYNTYQESKNLINFKKDKTIGILEYFVEMFKVDLKGDGMMYYQ